jgi:hypothetical protein
MEGVFAWPLGPVTLKRVGYLEDTIVQDNVNRIGAEAGDIFLFHFGEIDVRAYVKPWSERYRGTLDDLMHDWAHRYGDALAALELNGARIGIVSIVPPVIAERAYNASFPVAGTEEERVEYTKIINKHLAAECDLRGWPYVDVYSLYVDDSGMLPCSRSDRSVHIGNNKAVRELLVRMKLIGE